MQKITRVFAGGCVAAAMAFSMVLAPAAMAQGVTTADLGVEQPGLLPSNPFYFVKEWARGIRRVFTVDPVRRAEYELQVATEKAAELKRLEEVSDDARAIARAAENYAENVERLKERLSALSEISENPNVDVLLDSLVRRSLVHQELLGELKVKYEAVKDDIENAQKMLDEMLKEIPRAIDSAEKFRERLRGAIEERRDSAIKELNAINVLDRLNTDLPDEAPQKLSQLKDDLVLKFQGRVSAAPVAPGALEGFAGDAKEKLLVLDEVRERVLDPGLKNSLSQLRDRVLKEAEDAERIKEDDAKRMIQAAEELATKLAAQIRELGSAAPTSVKQLLERANASIEQAKTFYAAGQFGAAFGQATAAASAAKSALTQAAVRSRDFDRDIRELKEKFDELRALAGRAQLSREKNARVFALFEQAERAIVSLSGLPTTAAADRFVALSRETRALLGTLEAAIREATAPDRPLPATVKPPEPTVRPPAICAQVITPAKDPQSGACKEFPTPCDVPLGWVTVNACPAPAEEKATETREPSVTALQPTTWTITMGKDGFFPAELKARKGDKVIWTNKGSRNHWPASAIHPTHSVYPTKGGCIGSTFDACAGIAPGASYSFVFDIAGTWRYHDHLNSGLTGVIVVVE